MRFSPFRPQASKNEKLYVVTILSWIALTVFGLIYYYFKDIHFAPEPEVVPLALTLALLLALVSWIPLYKDRHPSNRVASHSIFIRGGVHAALLIALVSLAWGTFVGLIGPFVASSFGTPMSGTYVVTEKSSGYPDRRSCNHFVWLRAKDSRWLAKVCLRKEVWEAVQVGACLNGSGRRSILGHTIEQINWSAANTSLECTRAG